MNKKGFTLMELLLVVAILAIVAAAAAPTFSSGASDALREARKSAFLGAYQNAVTGAHMMIALAASKGYDIVSTNDTNLDTYTKTVNSEEVVHNLDYYSPVATRQFKNNKGDLYTLTAIVDNNHKLYIAYYPKNATTGDATKINDYTQNTDTSKQLDDTWNAINSGN